MRNGSKLTRAVHEAPVGSETPLQPSTTMEKSPGFAPRRVSDETTSGPFPVLVIPSRNYYFTT
jgi:hypothetical protein